jgi:tryptophanyl-tRNA synthetase
VTGKGVLNRAHAYKASVDKNEAAGNDPDADVTAGLFMYPVLMGADILLFKTHKVPVGRDQIQHIEMARDMAQRYNHLYGEHLVLPEAVIDESVALLPGLDGRKMSKSYDNTIPLFTPREQMRKLIAGIVTDSRAPGEPKEPKARRCSRSTRPLPAPTRRSTAQGLRRRHRLGRRQAAAVRTHRPRSRAHARALPRPDGRPGRAREILQAGAPRPAPEATPFMGELRQAVGLRNLGTRPARRPKGKAPKAPRPPSSNTAKRTASFISSCRTPMPGCCCKARASSRPGRPRR